jgi:amidase
VGADPGRLRVGLLSRPPGGAFQAHADCVAAAEATGRLLASLGHTVEESHPAALDDAEMGQHFGSMYAIGTARWASTIALLTGKPLGADDLDPLNWALVEQGRACSAMQYLDTIDWMNGYARRMASWWAGGFDVLVTPTLPEPPPPLGTFDPTRGDPMQAGMRAVQFAVYTSPFNLTGQPAISLPLGWSRDGLPIGVQLVGAYGREDLLLRLAAQLEAAQPWAARRPPVHA